MIGSIILNTILGGAGGGLTVLFINRLPGIKANWNYTSMLNATLTGTIAMVLHSNVKCNIKYFIIIVSQII